jgi:uroporphyrinogen-III synthase
MLINKTFISTRPSGQNEELRSLLEQEGANFIEMPTIEIEPAPLNDSDRELLRHIDRFSWIVFTSPNGVRFFFQNFNETIKNTQLPVALKIAVIGIKTAAVLEQYGYHATLINPGNTGKELGKELLEITTKDDNFLFPEGNLARRNICTLLAQKAKCTNLIVYHTVNPKYIDLNILNRIKKHQYELIILTSPSGFNNLIKAIDEQLSPKELKFICIGTTTANEVKAKGYTPFLTAQKASAEGIYESLLAHYSGSKVS